MTTPMLHSIQSSTQILGIGRSSLYVLIAEGEILPVKIGRRTLIPDREIRRYVESLTTPQAGMIIDGARG
jgi:excisionase family DNA binding protein